MTLINKYFKHGLLLSLVLGALFTFLGVYNTSSLPYFNRFVFWTATMIVGCIATGLSAPWIFNKLLLGRPVVLPLITLTLFISIPVTLVIAGFDHNYGLDWTGYVWLLQYRYVVVISAILIFGGYYVVKTQGLIPTEKEDAAEKFMQRLPNEYRQAQLYAISSQDHYLNVITDMGSTLILMRLSDAMKELETVSGMQTHRSWWVVTSSVTTTKRVSGKLQLELKSGDVVPVSRTYDKSVKDALKL